MIFKILRYFSKFRFTLILLAVGLFIWLSLPKEFQFSGRTMGTAFHIKAYKRFQFWDRKLKKKIHIRLLQINKNMSKYDPESELSKFNNHLNAEPLPVSYDLYYVLKQAKKTYELSNGAWDGTVKYNTHPSSFAKLTLTPSPSPVSSYRTSNKVANSGRGEFFRVPAFGFDKIELLEGQFVKKVVPNITVDLSSIAKGYGVDAIARLLKQAGFKSYFVEIGGEIYVAGQKPNKKPWLIGINWPDPKAGFNKIYTTVKLEDKAIATSGDYRQFFEINGQQFSHILDPVTGRPISHGVVSVSVIADSAVMADGLATAVMVMGTEKGLELLEGLEDVEGLIIIKNKKGDLIDYKTTGFPES